MGGVIEPLLIVFFTCSLVVEGSKEEYRLLKNLMRDYDPDVRPVISSKEQVRVDFDITLHQIMDLDERNQILTGSFWYRFTWRDAALTWSPAEYGNVTDIHVSAARIWRPDITLYNDVNIERRDIEALYAAVVSHDGRVRWHAPTVTSSSCQLDVTYFPWDEQRCQLQFGSWNYDGNELDLQNATPAGEMIHFMEDGEWVLVDIPVERKVGDFAGRPFPSLTFTVHIARKPLYYVTNIMLPCFYITVCGLLVFLLPPDSGEKVSVSVTILLASSVFLLVIAESMPPQSAVVPLIEKYFLCAITILVACTIVSVVILHLQFKGVLRRRVPKWMNKVLFQWLSRPLLLHDVVMDNLRYGTPPSANGMVNGTMENSCINLEKLDKLEQTEDRPTHAPPSDGPTLTNQAYDIHGSNKAQEDEEQCKKEWMLVVLVLDRFFFVLFLVVIVCVSAVMFGAHP